MIYRGSYSKSLKLILASALIALPMEVQAMFLDLSKATPNSWEILTDATERQAGKSGGALTFQNNMTTPFHLFMGFIDPQPNGAGFVTAWYPLDQTIKVEEQTLTVEVLPIPNDTFEYLVILKPDNGENEISLQARLQPGSNRSRYSFPLTSFTPSYRGKPARLMIGDEGLFISKVGIRAVGRLPENESQKGPFGLKLFSFSVQ